VAELNKGEQLNGEQEVLTVLSHILTKREKGTTLPSTLVTVLRLNHEKKRTSLLALHC
jgi:hypothetical protein